MVTLAATPIITRIYTPSQFGVFAGIVAVGSVFVGVSTLRLEIRGLACGDNDEASELFGLSLLTIAATSALVAAPAMVCAALSLVSLFYLTLPVFVLLASLQLVGQAQIIRSRDYRRLSRLQFGQASGVPICQALFGITYASSMGLIAGFLLPRLIWADELRNATWPRMALWRKNRRYAIIAGASALVNSLGGQLLVLCTLLAFGAHEVALVSMATRLLIGPLTVLGEAVAGAANGELSQLLRNGLPGARRLAGQTMQRMLLLALVPVGAAAAVAPVLAAPILGRSWADVGVIVAVLAPGALAQFVVAPFVGVLLLTGDAKSLLEWDLARLVVTSGAFALAFAGGQSLFVSLGATTLSSALAYLLLARRLLRALQD